MVVSMTEVSLPRNKPRRSTASDCLPRENYGLTPEELREYLKTHPIPDCDKGECEGEESGAR